MSRILQLNVILLCSIILLASFMFGGGLNSKFSIIDDHHIVAEVGPDNVFTLQDGLNVIKNDKDFDLGNYGRFRPSFQIAKTIEMYLFKKNPIYYNVTRFIIFILLMYVFTTFIFTKTDVLSGLIISLILLSEGAWPDIFSRNITSEIYSFFGLVVYLPISNMIYNSLNGDDKFKLSVKFFLIITYLASGLLSIGAKENFVFLIIVPIAILFVIYKSPNKNIFKAFIGLASIFLIGYGVFILSVIAWYFFNTKEDITGYGLSDNTLIKIIYNFFKVLLYEWGGGLLLLPVFLLWKIRRNEKHIEQYSKLKKHLLKMYIYLFILSLFLLFQVVYYTGGLPSGTRYDFPMVIFYSAYLLILVFYAKKILLIFVQIKYVKPLILIPLLLTFVVKDVVPNIIRTSEATESHVLHTEYYYKTIQKIILLANEDQSLAIVVNSFNVWDYELISSFYKFLRAEGLNNTFYLKLNYVALDYGTSVEREFVKRLSSISKGASAEINPKWTPNNSVLQFGYESIDDLKIGKDRCVLINISKINDSDMCANTITFEYEGR